MSFDRVRFQDPNSQQSAVPAVAPSTATTPMQPVTTRATVQTMPEASARSVRTQTQSGEKNMMKKGVVIALLLVAVVAGVGTGYGAINLIPGAVTSSGNAIESGVALEEMGGQIKVGAVFGTENNENVGEPATGVLIKGGLTGEGSHTLLRENGPSQNVYLTSSVVDLDQFDGMSVTVWGETYKAQKAGWLMDVLRLEVKDTSADRPSWYTEKE